MAPCQKELGLFTNSLFILFTYFVSSVPRKVCLQRQLVKIALAMIQVYSW